MGWVSHYSRAILLLAGLTSLAPAGFATAQNLNADPKKEDSATPIKGTIDFGGKPVRIEIRPKDSFFSTGTTQIFLATVYDDKHTPVKRCKVEWAVSGTGDITNTAEGTQGNTQTRNNIRYLTANTVSSESTQTVDGHSFVVRPGQTWIAIRSNVEGQTNITMDSPEMDRDGKRRSVKVIWVDAKWKLPVSINARIGTEAVLKATVVRMKDEQPLQGYVVRYRVIEGPSCQWVGSAYKSESGEGIAITDANGLAVIRLTQVSPTTTVNRLAIDIARPDPTNNSNVVLGKGEATVNWHSPDLSASVDAPKSAPIGEEFTTTLSVTNNGRAASQGVFIRLNLPAGVQVTSSSERATRDGNEILWSLPSVPAGKQSSLQLKLKGSQLGLIRPAFNVRSADNQTIDAFTDVLICKPSLQISLKGPETGVLDEALPFELTVKNAGNGAAEAVEYDVLVPPGLTAENGPNSLKQLIESLPAGESKIIPISLKAEKPGSYSVRASANSAGSQFTPSEPITVTIGNPQLSVSVKGPAMAFVNQPVEWVIHVENPSEVELTNVTLRAVLPPEVKFQNSDKDGKAANGAIEWTLGTAPKRQSLDVRVTGICTSVTSRAVLSATVSADPLVKREGVFRTASLSKALRAEASCPVALEVLGVPALHMEVSDSVDPVKVGNRTTYIIRIRNTGTLAATKLQLRGEVAANMKPVAAYGFRENDRGDISGQKVAFPVWDTLKPGDEIVFRVEAEAVTPGEARFKAELKSLSHSRAISVEEMTSVRPGSRTEFDTGRSDIRR